MGAELTAPLATVGGGGSDAINEALAVEPEHVPAALRPLLDLDLHGLCEAYRRVMEKGCQNVPAEDLERELGLPSAAAKVIAARRPAVAAVEVLTVLAVLSHTHACAKARFLHVVSVRSGTGKLTFQEFRGGAAALLRSACFIAQVPRGRWPKMAAVDVLVRPLFEPHESEGLTKSHCLTMLMGASAVWKWLQRFARGAVEQHFLLAACSGGNSERAPDDIQGQDHRGNTLSVLPKHDVQRRGNAGHVRTPPPSIYKVLPRRPRSPDVELATPAEDDEAMSSVLEEETPRKGKKTHSNRSTPRNPKTPSPPLFPKTGRYGSQLPQSRRRGYFQAIPSKGEMALLDRLQRVQNEKVALGKVKDVELNSTICHKEKELRENIRADIINEDRRRNYRLHIEHMRSGMISLPAGAGVLPPGCFWTASQEHVDCGGVLPYRCTSPLTPTTVQRSIHNHELIADTLGNTGSHQLEATPTTLDDLLSQVLCTSRRLSSSPLSSTGKKPSDDDEASQVSQSSVSQQSHRRPVHLNAKPHDVLLAFDIYRTCYWRSDPEVKTHRDQRDMDMEKILAECLEAKTAWKDTTQSLMSMFSFFQTIWPALTSPEFKAMLKIIERSKNVDKVDAEPPVESPQRQAETLRELIELFDAIDTEKSGFVPLEAVEQFLCGELLTARESEHLAYQRNLDSKGRGGLMGTPAGCEAYVDHIKEHNRFRFMTTKVEDRDEWSVTAPDRERGWDVFKQARFSVKGGETPSTSKKVAKTRDIIGQRMEKLAEFLDEENARLQIFSPGGGDDDFANGAAGAHGAVPCGDLEVACTPRLIPPRSQESANNDSARRSPSPTDSTSMLDDEAPPRGTLRLVRLYWRYLLGSAVQQQLRDNEQQGFNLRTDGFIDLVGFVCILAHDQYIGLCNLWKTKGVQPTAKAIRETAYAK